MMQGGGGMMGSGMMGWGWLIGLLVIVLLIAAIVALVVVLSRSSGSSGSSGSSNTPAQANPQSDALETLRQRFARGEMSREEFEQSREALRQS
jgi:putative membrane protein